jgi:5-methylcytosine-specific restriction enzyme A
VAWETDAPRRDRLPSDWPAIRVRILNRDAWRCQLGYDGCRILAQQVDHVVPGDDHTPGNLQAVCERCHALKSAREGAEGRAAVQRRSRRTPEPHPGALPRDEKGGG